MAQRSITSFFSRVPSDNSPKGPKASSSKTDNEEKKKDLDENEKKVPLREYGPLKPEDFETSEIKPEILEIIKKENQENSDKEQNVSEPEINVEQMKRKVKTLLDVQKTKNSGKYSGVKTKSGKKRRKIVNPLDSSSEEENDEKNKKLKVTHENSPKKKTKIDDKNSTTESNKVEEKNNLPDKENKKPSLSYFFAKNKDVNSSNAPENIDYNPSKSKYHPIDDAIWTQNEKVPYIALAKTWEQIESISARLRIIEVLSNYFRSVIVLTPDDLLPSVYLCLNRLAPAYEGLELGIADTHLMKSIAQSTGRSLGQIKTDFNSLGDLGLVAERSRSNQSTFAFRRTALTVRDVFASLKEISRMSGHASVQKKIDKIKTMIVMCKDCEARFLVRSLTGKLRIGLAEQSVLQSLALACAVTPPNQDSYPPKILDASSGQSTDRFKQTIDDLSLTLKTTFCECPTYDKIIPILLEKGIKELPNFCKLTPGIPLKPMLAQPTKGVQEVLDRFEGSKFTCEWKYDGERAQIHRLESGIVKIYSRNQEDNTSKYPDIISRIVNCVTDDVQSFILDCESVAWDREAKRILPFQILSTRKRKDASESEIKVQVCVFMFDLLYLNGESLVRKTLSERRALLKKHFVEREGEWRFATSIDATKMDEVQEFLDESVKGNCEGLMVKTLLQDATYEIAKRSRNWLKLKKDYLDGVGDTLDCVVIGGYLGKGKRTGTYGGFLLACYDQENEEYQSICKIGTGFSDESLQKHTEFFKSHIIPEQKSYYRVDSSHVPDHWFDVVQVWEVKCADLSLSPVHRAAIGIVDAEKGISLRFPRFCRVRDDKNVEDATSAQQVADMYSNQDQIKNQQGSNKITEEDFY